MLCQDCDEAYCSLCWAALHRRGERAKHETTPLGRWDAWDRGRYSGTYSSSAVFFLQPPCVCDGLFRLRKYCVINQASTALAT